MISRKNGYSLLTSAAHSRQKRGKKKLVKIRVNFSRTWINLQSVISFKKYLKKKFDWVASTHRRTKVKRENAIHLPIIIVHTFHTILYCTHLFASHLYSCNLMGYFSPDATSSVIQSSCSRILGLVPLTLTPICAITSFLHGQKMTIC